MDFTGASLHDPYVGLAETTYQGPMEWYETPYFAVTVSIFAVISFMYLTGKLTNFLTKKEGTNALAVRFIRQTIIGIIVIWEIVFVISKLDFLSGIVPILLTGSTVLMASIGFAAQGAIANVLCGIAILLSKPFKVGDEIKLQLSGISGEVKSINLRHTVILTTKNTYVMVPNATMNNDSLENSEYGDDSFRQVVSFRINCIVNIGEVLAAIEKFILEHRYYYDIPDEFESLVYVNDISDKGVEIRAIVETENKPNNYVMCSDLRKWLLQELPGYGVTFWMGSTEIKVNANEKLSEKEIIAQAAAADTTAKGENALHPDGIKEKEIPVSQRKEEKEIPPLVEGTKVGGNEQPVRTTGGYMKLSEGWNSKVKNKISGGD